MVNGVPRIIRAYLYLVQVADDRLTKMLLKDSAPVVDSDTAVEDVQDVIVVDDAIVEDVIVVDDAIVVDSVPVDSTVVDSVDADQTNIERGGIVVETDTINVDMQE